MEERVLDDRLGRIAGVVEHLGQVGQVAVQCRDLRLLGLHPARPADLVHRRIDAAQHRSHRGRRPRGVGVGGHEGGAAFREPRQRGRRDPLRSVGLRAIRAQGVEEHEQDVAPGPLDLDRGVRVRGFVGRRVRLRPLFGRSVVVQRQAVDAKPRPHEPMTFLCVRRFGPAEGDADLDHLARVGVEVRVDLEARVLQGLRGALARQRVLELVAADLDHDPTAPDEVRVDRAHEVQLAAQPCLPRQAEVVAEHASRKLLDGVVRAGAGESLLVVEIDGGVASDGKLLGEGEERPPRIATRVLAILEEHGIAGRSRVRVEERGRDERDDVLGRARGDPDPVHAHVQMEAWLQQRLAVHHQVGASRAARAAAGRAHAVEVVEPGPDDLEGDGL